MLVRTETQLRDLCVRLREAGCFALDTEFAREHSYYGRLGIVQVATDNLAAVIDPGAIGNLNPLMSLIVDPAVEKVVHAGKNDFLILFERSGQVPVNVFDTQIAGAFLGDADEPSLKRLLSEYLGIELEKSESVTDWTARPLTPAQIEYALGDVRHLLELRRRLLAVLNERGRTAWVVEETAFLESPTTYQRAEPLLAYRKVRKSADARDPQYLGVLRQLAAWRERAAEAEDVPPGRILNDEALDLLARRRPARRAELDGQRRLHSSVAATHGHDIIAAIRAGLAEPVVEARESIPREDDAAVVPPVLLSVLESLLQLAARRSQIAPRKIAKADEIRTAVQMRHRPEIGSIRLMQGWRHEVFGRDVAEFLAGRTALTFDPVASEIRAMPRPRE